MDKQDELPPKPALRAELRAARRALGPDERARASQAIGVRLDALPELAGARRVLAYAAMADEVDLDPWLRARLRAGRAVYLPRVEGFELRLGAVTDLDADLTPGWRGLREPRRLDAAPEDVDAAVVPGVAFDEHGHRLGRGGGHVDRLLARLRPGVVVVGVAFEVQIVDRVPVAAHDVGVDLVVTEQRALRVR